MMSWSITPELINLLTVVGAYGLAMLFLPLCIRLATQHGTIDRTDTAHRTRPAAPIPRLGGVGIMVALQVVAFLAMELSASAPTFKQRMGPSFVPFTLGLGLVFLTGLWDDLRGMRARTKLALQLIATTVVVSQGFVIERLTLLPGMPAFELGAVAPLVTALWIVGITNAFNLIDGVDGLAAATALVALGGILVVDTLNGGSVFPHLLAMIGALLAFLRFNRHPARLYLGDAGSLSLGFFLAVRSVIAASDSTQTVQALLPLALLAYPLFDTSTTIVRRWLRGDGIMTADHRHVHHQLQAIGLSVPQTVWLLTLVSAVAAATGVISVIGPRALMLPLAVPVLFTLLFTLLFGARWLGYREFLALLRSVRSVLGKWRRTIQLKIRLAELSETIAAAPSLFVLGDTLTTLVDGTRVVGLELALESPGQPAVVTGVRPIGTGYTLHQHLVTVHSLAGVDTELTLRCWSTYAGLRHHTADRIVTTLSPALRRWLSVQPAARADSTRRTG